MNRSLLIHLGIALVVLVAVGGGYEIWTARLAAVGARIDNVSAAIGAKEAEIARAKTLRAELPTFTKDETLVSTHTVSKSDIITFLNVLEAAGRFVHASVSILSVTPQKTGPHHFLTVSVKIVGTFDAVMRTVGIIENMPYYITTSSLSLGANSTAKKNSWNAGMTLTVGYTPSTTPAQTQP